MAIAKRPKSADPATKAKLDVDMNPSKKKARNKPKCPTHHEDMVYVPHEGMWQCTITGCKKVAVPKEDVTEGNRPIIGRGEVEMFVATDKDNNKRTCLRTPSNNVIIDITDLIVTAAIERTLNANVAELRLEVPFVKLDGDEGDPFEGDPSWQQIYLNSDGTTRYKRTGRPSNTVWIDSDGVAHVDSVIEAGMITAEKINADQITYDEMNKVSSPNRLTSDQFDASPFAIAEHMAMLVRDRSKPSKIWGGPS